MDSRMDFADILASTLHDTKNSLGMLFNTLEEVIAQCNSRHCDQYQGFFLLQYEIKRLNNSLIRLLALYKAEKSQLMMNLDYYSVSEFLEDIIAQHAPLLGSRGIDIEMDCPDGLFRAFDRGLVAGVLDNILNNAFRYTRDRVRLSAGEEGGFLAIRIEDNGPGYPECMMIRDSETDHFMKKVNFDTGSTGLGLYFSMLVAKAHKNKDLEGYISITNGGTFGGGVFTVCLP